MTKKFLILIICLLTTCFSNHPKLIAEVLQFENQTIGKVEIFVHSKSGVISDTNANLTRLRTQKGQLFSQADFDEDLKVLSADYDRVDPEVIHDAQEVSITIHVWPKPTIRTIHWHGNHSVTTTRLQKELAIKVFLFLKGKRSILPFTS